MELERINIEHHYKKRESVDHDVLSWMEYAKCAEDGVDPTMFDKYTRKAIQMCSRCPVKKQCLEAALMTSPEEDMGIRGGTRSLERMRYRKVMKLGSGSLNFYD